MDILKFFWYFGLVGVCSAFFVIVVFAIVAVTVVVKAI